MTAKALSILLTLVLGSVFVINGVGVKAEDAISRATEAVNGANLHQLATVLEVYYLDNGRYPDAQNGTELVNELQAGNYILNRPLDPEAFKYSVTNNGENYHLALASSQ